MRKILLGIILLVLIVSFGYCQDKEQPPWANKAPNSYTKDSVLVKESYKEAWIKSSPEKHIEAVHKAKEVFRQWGRNPDNYEYDGKNYDYEILISESPNFISVVFYPIGLNVTSQEVEIRMTKDNLEVLSILRGS